MGIFVFEKYCILFFIASLPVIYPSSSTSTFEKRRTGELRKACVKFGNAIQPSNRIYTKERVEELRDLMVNTSITLDQRLLDAYYIPSQDEHQNEFVEDYEKRLQYISGFSGSNGQAIITTNRKGPSSAVLWTDGRYHLQADNEIDCGWKLMREGFYYVPNVSQWLHEYSPNGGVMGADPKLISHTKWIGLAKELKKFKWELVEIQNNLIDVIWNKEREPRRNKKVFVLEEKYAGQKWTTKLTHLRRHLKKLKVDAMVITSLEEIAWLLNLRGRDTPYSPFFRSYILLDMDRLRLYINKTQLEADNIIDYFQNSTQLVEILNYDRICPDLTSRSQIYTKILVPSEIAVNSAGASHNLTNCIPPNKRLLNQSPIILMKARKNKNEIHGMRTAHIRDAAAMCEFFAYFDRMFKEGTRFTELDIVKIIDQFRYEQLNSLGNSFPTIAAFGLNGALPHYIPTSTTNEVITDQSTLVLDSGGQYLDGSTDVTRTIHFGVPTPEQKEAYTRVLIGQIQMASLTFPAFLPMAAIDVMARAPLWDVGGDYAHGTGHGIGAFLNVHEPPISVYFNDYNNLPENSVLLPGYFLSNEPGYYSEGEFGIRLENVMEVIEKTWLKGIHGIPYLGFKTITLVPYEPKLIDLKLLSNQQIRWLNKYNDQIRIHVGAELKKQNLMQGFYWMMDKTNHFRENGSENLGSFSGLVTIFVITLTLL